MSKGKNWLMFMIRTVRDLGILAILYFIFKYITTSNGAMMLTVSNLIMGIIFLAIMYFIYNFISDGKKQKFNKGKIS